jgi:hypothetical protein
VDKNIKGVLVGVELLEMLLSVHFLEVGHCFSIISYSTARRIAGGEGEGGSAKGCWWTVVR